MAQRTTTDGRFPALQHREFRALWGGTACSSVALWTLLLGNAYTVYHLSDSSFWVGMSTFASMSPFLLAPFGGVIADRVERRHLVRSTRVGALVCSATLVILAGTGVITVWMVLAVALIQGVVRAVEIPADQALLANVVPQRHLENAVVLTTMTQQGSRAVGPILAGPLLASMGGGGAYMIAAIFAALAFVSVGRLQTSSRGGVTDLRAVTENLKGGIGYVRRTGPVAAIFMLVVAHCALTMSFDAMLPGFAEQELHHGDSAFTVMTFGVGIGALLGTFGLTFLTKFPRGPLFFGIALVSGITPLVMAVSTNLPSATVSAILMGSSQSMFMALSAVLLQEVLPDDVRGRVMSLYLMVAGGMMAVANLVFASIADITGAPALFLFPALIYLVFLLASTRVGPYLRVVYRGGVVPIPQPAAN
ncbi:MAG: MFS transporter [Tepidiformaceae bacterium]